MNLKTTFIIASVGAVAAAFVVEKLRERQSCKTFDERLEDLHSAIEGLGLSADHLLCIQERISDVYQPVSYLDRLPGNTLH